MQMSKFINLQGDDSVVQCVTDGEGKIDVQHSYNEGKNNIRVRNVSASQCLKLYSKRHLYLFSLFHYHKRNSVTLNSYCISTETVYFSLGDVRLFT